MKSTRASLVPVTTLFVLNGVSLGSWLSRVPAARDALHLGAAQMGAVLLCPGLGALVGLPLAGMFVSRAGPRRAFGAGAAGVGAALGLITVGLKTGTPAIAGLGLAAYGFSISSWDVAMNVVGADLEHDRDRSLLPGLHAGLSLGTIVGTAAGALAAWAGVHIASQLVATGVVVLVVGGFVGRFVPSPHPLATTSSPPRVATAWREARTLRIGGCVLAFALCEGIAGDWLALSLVDGHGYDQAVSAVGYGVFVAALTSGRAAGSSLLARLGRVGALRVLTVCIVVGVLIVVFVAALPVVFIGAALWGAGVSLGFPVGMSAAADDPDRAAVRVSVVSSIGYAAFFTGPPLVGVLIHIAGLPHALLIVIAAAVLAAALSASTAQQPVPSG